jgi:hypothetical protein
MFLYNVKANQKFSTIIVLFADRLELNIQQDNDCDFCSYRTNIARRNNPNARTNPANTDTSILIYLKVKNIKYVSSIVLQMRSTLIIDVNR